MSDVDAKPFAINSVPLSLIRHCEEQSDEAIQLCCGMDCFVEFIIGRAFARPVGSQ
jgi:hypothetical protein